MSSSVSPTRVHGAGSSPSSEIPAVRHRRVSIKSVDVAVDGPWPSLADLRTEEARARRRGDARRAYLMRVAIMARVLRARREARAAA